MFTTVLLDRYSCPVSPATTLDADTVEGVVFPHLDCEAHGAALMWNDQWVGSWAFARPVRAQVCAGVLLRAPDYVLQRLPIEWLD